ncbi:MAG: PQQ-binding-like beta-propeller repeat protein [Candidatus Aenigmatarchaeota archaeon]
MEKYYSFQSDLEKNVSFSIDRSAFGNLELSNMMENVIDSKTDTTWIVGIGGSLYAAPLISDDVIYIGACDKNFYAIDAESGTELWRFSTGDVIISTAAIDNGVIYFGSYDGNLYAVNTKGGLVWKFAAGDKVYSDPCIWKDKIYFGSHNGNIYAVNKVTGHLVWSLGTHGSIASSGMIDNDTLYIGSTDKNLYAINAETGEIKWKFPTGDVVRHKPEKLNEKIIFVSLDGSARAVNEDGELLWKFDTGDGISSYPLLFGDIIFIGSRDMNWYALNEDGELLWSYKGKGYPNELVVVGDKVYIGCCENGLYILDKKTGKELEVLPTGGWVVRIRNYKDRIYFSCWDCNLYSITRDPELVWKFHTSLSSQSPLETGEQSPTKTLEIVWADQTLSDKEDEYKEKNKPDIEFGGYGNFDTGYSMNTYYVRKKKNRYG